ncbi:selenoprotein M-like [Hylaeus anthracinus]|uniref:selenoprotein M-like n=1 Tax=Hylaeus anthracinus TaxID=313031 RepID=UPI0023B9C486|nr:selenoprotein M-like [Hylaeus anthracinus]
MARTLVVIYFLAFIFAISNVNSTNSYYSFARIESCSGCRLNRLPDVKDFIFEDVPTYDKVEFKHIRGADPELVLFNEDGEEVERLDIALLTRDECNNLLTLKGFVKKPKQDEL